MPSMPRMNWIPLQERTTTQRTADVKPLGVLQVSIKRRKRQTGKQTSINSSGFPVVEARSMVSSRGEVEREFGFCSSAY